MIPQRGALIFKPPFMEIFPISSSFPFFPYPKMVKSGYPNQTIGKEGVFVPFLRTKKGLFESTRIQFLPVDSIRPNPNQPRRYFSPEGLQELAASIAAHGILQPLSVRRAEAGYELISGERRLRSAQLAGLSEVPCLIVTADETQSSLLALIENVQRRDLDFWEEALAIQALLEATSLSQEALAKQLGKAQSSLANKLRLLRLPPNVLDLLRQNGFTERHARALLRLSDPAVQQSAAQYIVDHDLTVAKTEAHIDALLHPAPKRSKPTFLLKDVRFFLNTVTRGLSLMQSAGVKAAYDRQDTDHEILLTIRIPR